MISFVHGRLPYDRIKPDPQLRNLIRSISQRKIVSPQIEARNDNYNQIFRPNETNSFVIAADFYEFGPEPRGDGVGSPGVERLLRTDHMLRDDEPEAIRVDPARGVPGGSEAVDGGHADCDRSGGGRSSSNGTTAKHVIIISNNLMNSVLAV